MRSEVTAARTWEALRDAESLARDPVTRAGELLQQIGRERDTRREAAEQTGRLRRSRSLELAPARTAAGVILELLPGAHGPELAALKHQAQQLEQSPPVSEAERLRRIRAFGMEQADIARRLNPYG